MNFSPLQLLTPWLCILLAVLVPMLMAESGVGIKTLTPGPIGLAVLCDTPGLGGEAKSKMNKVTIIYLQ